uniref:Uncharacterized protein n=1 Tax=Caenorhabditis tropicalis TaxID=1561998 RepID=A0A1I7TSV9_9PELO
MLIAKLGSKIISSFDIHFQGLIQEKKARRGGNIAILQRRKPIVSIDEDGDTENRTKNENGQAVATARTSARRSALLQRARVI